MESNLRQDLQPETSHGIDWGIVFEPTFVKGLRASLDYTRVTKYNDIVIPATATLIADAAQFPGRVSRGTPNAGQSVGPIVLLNDTYINAPVTITASYDMEVDYTLRTASAGTFKLSGLATSWQHYQIQSVLGGAFVEQLANPNLTAFGAGASLAKFKGNLALDWTRGPFSAGWLVRYTGPYTDGSANGTNGSASFGTGTYNGWVSGQIYHDVYAGYSFGPAIAGGTWWTRALADTKVRLGVKNVLDHYPPYDGYGGWLPFDYSAYGDIQGANYYFSVTKSW